METLKAINEIMAALQTEIETQEEKKRKTRKEKKELKRKRKMYQDFNILFDALYEE